MTAHLFGGLGMMPFGIQTDPGLPNFMQRARAMIPGLVLHGPVRDYQTGELAAQRDALPEGDLAFYVGTSLSANDAFIIAGYSKKLWDGVFMFQASDWGPKSIAPSNVKFAHLVYSYLPIPVPLIGAYIPEPGPLVVGKNYIQTNVNLPHPGDYDLGSQRLFIEDMQRIIAASKLGVALSSASIAQAAVQAQAVVYGNEVNQ